jgi:hypothetical protein
MLSHEERKRLAERNSKDMDSQIRASNDARARRKLATWLKEDLQDVYLILDKLPEDQLKRILTDDNAYYLLDLAAQVMRIKGFCPIEGEFGHPESWKALKSKPDYIEGWEPFILRRTPDKLEAVPVSDLDIQRSVIFGRFLKVLRKFFATPKASNPVSFVDPYIALLADPTFKDRVTEEERRGVDRVLKALEATR